MLDNTLLYGSVAGFAWLSLLTVYYAVLRKRRAVLSMFASFAVAGVVTVWTAVVLLAGAALYHYLFGGLTMSWELIFSIFVAAYVISVAQLTLFFVFNQWSVRRIVRRYRSLVNEELTQRLNETVDMSSMVEEFDIGQVEVLVVDDLEANAHTMALARPSLFSPKLGKDVLVVKRPLVETLDGDELRAALAHELAHIEELDARFRPYFEVLARVYFFDPFIRVIRSRMRRLQEYGADERAVEVTGDPAALARALVKVADRERDVRGATFEVKERAERLSSLADGGGEKMKATTGTGT